MTDKSFRPAITAESRSLKNQATIQKLDQRLVLIEKKIAKIQTSCERFAKLFSLHGGA